jgi:hypothetical protein
LFNTLKDKVVKCNEAHRVKIVKLRMEVENLWECAKIEKMKREVLFDEKIKLEQAM